MIDYSEYYERLKKDGVKPALIPINTVQNYQEEWLPVTETAVPDIVLDKYYISNYGKLYDVELNKYVNIRHDKDGYCIVSIHRNNNIPINVKLHRLILLVFNYNINYKKLQVNHIDGNPSNNVISNLEWVTAKQNSDHSMLYGLHKMNGSDNPNNKLSEQQVHEICKLIETGKYYDTEIAKMYKVSYTNISDIHNRKIWRSISRYYNMDIRKHRKLEEYQVREICEMLISNKYSIAQIARMYKVSSQSIQSIIAGDSWYNIAKQYNIVGVYKPKPIKFTDQQVHEICKLIETGKYYDTEIAKMYDTTPTYLYSLRNGKVHKDIAQQYNLTIRKS